MLCCWEHKILLFQLLYFDFLFFIFPASLYSTRDIGVSFLHASNIIGLYTCRGSLYRMLYHALQRNDREMKRPSLFVTSKIVPYSAAQRSIPEVLTQYIEPRLGATDSYSGWYIDGDAAERSQVQSPVDRQYPKVTRVLITAGRVDQCPSVEGPVESDVSSTGDVTSETEVFSLDDVLTDWCWVEIETILGPWRFDYHCI